MSNNNHHEISLQEAIEMTTRYRANRPANFPICESFEKDAIARLLETEGCAFFRIYYGMKEDLSADAILVAANAEGEDILPPANGAPAALNNPLILEDGIRCPEACPPPSPLNGH